MKKPNLSCVDCGKHGEAYFVKDKVWYDNVPVSKQRKNLCLSCLEKRMGRKLKKSDFKQDDGTFTTNQQWWGRVGESMNIKRIIREETNNFDWIDDINPYADTDGVYKALGEAKIDVSVLTFLRNEFNNMFFVILLKNNMGVVDITIDDGAHIKHFPSIQDWNNTYNAEGYTVEDMDDVERGLFDIMNKVLHSDRILIGHI